METKEIKKGELLDAFETVAHDDESTKELLLNMPLVHMAFMIIVSKMEDVIFGEE